MHTLLFTLVYPHFKVGVANYYENLVKYWPKTEEIFVLDNNNNKLINNKLPFLKWLLSIWQLFNEIKKNNINHVIIGQILPLGTATLIIYKILGIKYSIILHGMDFSLAIKTPRKKLITRLILKNAKNVICANNYTANLVKQIANNKISVVNPGVNIKQLRNNSFILTGELIAKYNLKNKIILFSLGRLVKRKGFDKVIEAMPKILPQIPNLRYFIAGTGPDEKYLKDLPVILKESASRRRSEESRFKTNSERAAGTFVPDAHQDDERVIFLGKITDKEKWAWLAICDIFIMPARNINNDFEGFGIVYLEANLFSKPVIAGHSGGVGDAVADGVNGILVNPENINDISQVVINLAKNKNLRNKLGNQGRSRALKDFDWQKQINIIYNIINKN